MQPDSDELRVYDLEEGVLRRAFVWRSQAPGEVRQQPEGDHPPFLFRLQTAGDLDHNGKAEIVGAFERLTLASAAFAVPVLLAWDEGAERYRLSPLLMTAPRLPRLTRVDTSVLAGYRRPTVIRNRADATEHAVVSFGVAEFDVRSGPRSPLFTALFVLPALDYRKPTSSYVRSYALDLQGATPRAIECHAETSTAALGGFTGSESQALRDRLAGRALSNHGTCG